MKRLISFLLLVALLPIAVYAQADKKLIEKAEAGDINSMIMLGKCYEWGAGVPHDSTMALQWFRKAADKGSCEAWINIAKYYISSTLVPHDTARFYSICKEWADKGCPNAIAALGSAYLYGTGVQADTARALELFNLAAKKGSDFGMYSLGLAYCHGELGVKKDEKRGFAYFEKAVKKDMFFYGYDYIARAYASKNDFSMAWKYVNEPLKWKQPDAVTIAALMYYYGNGVTMNEAKAQQMMSGLVAEHHNLEWSQDVAGLVYMVTDDPALRDTVRGLQYWKEGDAFGSDGCTYRLARHYFNTDRPAMAKECLMRIVNKKKSNYGGEACYLLSQMAYEGQGEEQDIDAALSWLRIGADQYNNAQCATTLAGFYEGMDDDSGMDNSVIVERYYRRADELGDTNALAELGKYFANQGNTVAATMCFNEMIQNGNLDGYYWDAVLYASIGSDTRILLNKFLLGDKKGSVKCSETLGEIYEAGYGIVEPDNKKALKYYERAATPSAYYNIAMLYLKGEYGKRSKKDIAKGFDYLNRSADMGYIDAINTLGYCYETGMDVDSVDHVRALYYYKLLADNNVALGQFKMGLYYELGDGGLPVDSVKAIEFYTKAAEQGHGEAMCYLGDFYRIGRFLPLDREKAFEYYMSAHEADEEIGTYYVARSYLEGCGVDIDTSAAIPYLRMASDQGVGKATYLLGEFFNYGKGGMTQDNDSALYYYINGHQNGSGDASYVIGTKLAQEEMYAQAVEYFYTGAVRGNNDAMILFAICLQSGIGIDEDPAEAYKIMQIARSRVDDPRVYSFLGLACLQGNGCPEDESLGKSYLDTAANLGSESAMYYLGICYMEGYGCDPDTTIALRWLEKAADAGSMRACNMIGDYYEEREEFDKAVLYFQKAADNGDLTGICNLGYCYEKGNGVTLSYKKAYQLYMTAATQGSIRAYKMIANCYLEGIHVEQDAVEALNWLTKAADAGDVHAMYVIGSLLEDGENGIVRDLKKAKEWYKKAAAAGYEPAQAALNRLK